MPWTESEGSATQEYPEGDGQGEDTCTAHNFQFGLSIFFQIAGASFPRNREHE